MDAAESHLSALHRDVLAWDYVDVELDALPRARCRRAGKKRAGGGESDEDDDAGEDARSLRADVCRVPLTFASSREYVETFEPLLLAECAAIVRRGEDEERRDEAGGRGATRVVGVVKVQRNEEFHSVTFALNETQAAEFHDNDLVLLSKLEFTDAAEGRAREKARETHAIGVVEGRDSKVMIRVRFYLPDMSSLETRARGKSGEKRAKMDERAERDHKRFRTVKNALTAAQGKDERWHLKNLASLSTVTREWLAIHAFPSLPYASTILKGVPAAEASAAVAANAWTMPDGLRSAIEHAYNDSQVKALKTALSRDPLVLIQGPPGTGKTRTILSLLSVLLHSVPSTSSKTQVDFQSYAKMRQACAKRSPEERHRAWRAASPWMSGAPNARDAPPLISAVNGADVGATHATSTPRHGAVAQSLGADAYKRSKILVCAPSNSALDEIVLRILQNGLVDASGATYSPTVVRVGVNVHHSVNSVHIDTLVSQRLGELGTHVDSVRRFEAAIERDRLRQAILEEASVVCSTLSFSGTGMFSRMSKPFDAVIIDEAAQAVEPSTLVPLSYGAKQVFLVGDPRQLPATVLSAVALDSNYDMSMFKRFEQCGYPVHMLKTQYRMHPAIRAFPSKFFYDDELVDGPDMVKLNTRPWHKFAVFRPFVFFDVKGTDYTASGHSWANDDEAEFTVCLIQTLLKRFPELGSGEQVAVISPYKAQVKNIKKLIAEKLGSEKARAIDVNTIDGFQGREKDVCIFSVVRAPENRRFGGGLGFVADERRVNVGLTRAKASLFVVGSADGIRGDEKWGGLVENAYHRKCALTPSKPYRDFFNKHTADYQEGDLSGDEDEYDACETGEAPSLVVDDGEDVNLPKPRISESHHVHNPHWSGAAEFIRANDLGGGDAGFSKDGFRDDLIIENSKKGEAVGGDGDDMLADVEDGDDANRDEFTETADEPARKKPTRRSARA